MTIKPDHLLLLVASMVGIVLISRARPVMAQQQRTSLLLPGSGSPETVYWGGTTYNSDDSGMRYSASGADVRARR